MSASGPPDSLLEDSTASTTENNVDTPHVITEPEHDSSPLWGLAKEVRLEIYKHIFMGSSANWNHRKFKQRYLYVRMGLRTYTQSLKVSAHNNILFASKAVYKDALSCY